MPCWLELLSETGQVMLDESNKELSGVSNLVMDTQVDDRRSDILGCFADAVLRSSIPVNRQHNIHIFVYIFAGSCNLTL